VLDGAPVVLPTSFGRDGDTLYLHGSSGAASLLAAAAGTPVCVTVTRMDGVVYARSVFSHSVNYASAVIHGTARELTDPGDKCHALRVLVEHLAPGSWDHARGPTRREIAATCVLALPLDEASLKVRTGPPGDTDEPTGPVWAGVLPLTSGWGTPQPCPRVPAGMGAPPHVTGRCGSPASRFK